jgi:hypothetical protein
MHLLNHSSAHGLKFEVLRQINHIRINAQVTKLKHKTPDQHLAPWTFATMTLLYSDSTALIQQPKNGFHPYKVAI